MTRILSINLRSSRRGSILVVGTLSMSVLLGFMGLALDASYLYYHKRSMQTAADAGSIAGALELLRGAVGTSSGASRVTAAAKNDTALNGFTDAQGGVTVTVNNPPLSGPSAGNSAFVEVIISQAQGTWFMRALGTNSATVTARAVANSGGNSPGCIYTLNRGSGNNEGFFINGTSSATSSCGIYSNSNFRAVGTGCVNSAFVSYVDTYLNGTGCSPNVSAGVPFVDPLYKRYSPPSMTCDPALNNFSINGGTNVVISPGVYCGGISINGSASSITFTAGSYVLVGGGLTVRGSAPITGTGVTFFDTCSPNCNGNNYGQISMNGSGYVNLSAPTSGTYKGLLFWQDDSVHPASNNGSVITGGPSPSTGANSVFDGILYFPTTDLTYGGGSSVTTGGTVGYTMLIGYNVTMNGNSQINSDYSAIGGNPLAVAQFSE
jgi:Flp pilus assembly protein TadG